MSAQSLLRALLIDLESSGEWLIALDIRKRAERLIVDDTADDAADLGALPGPKAWNSPTIKVRAA